MFHQVAPQPLDPVRQLAECLKSIAESGQQAFCGARRHITIEPSQCLEELPLKARSVTIDLGHPLHQLPAAFFELRALFGGEHVDRDRVAVSRRPPQ